AKRVLEPTRRHDPLLEQIHIEESQFFLLGIDVRPGETRRPKEFRKRRYALDAAKAPIAIFHAPDDVIPHSLEERDRLPPKRVVRMKKLRARSEFVPAPLRAPLPTQIASVVLVESDARLAERCLFRARYFRVLFHRSISYGETDSWHPSSYLGSVKTRGHKLVAVAGFEPDYELMRLRVIHFTSPQYLVAVGGFEPPIFRL